MKEVLIIFKLIAQGMFGLALSLFAGFYMIISLANLDILNFLLGLIMTYLGFTIAVNTFKL